MKYVEGCMDGSAQQWKIFNRLTGRTCAEIVDRVEKDNGTVICAPFLAVQAISDYLL